jgi:hypothetical protein
MGSSRTPLRQRRPRGWPEHTDEDMSKLVLEPNAGGQGAVVDKGRHFDAIVAARR